MSVSVRVPTPLQRLTAGESEVVAEGASVGQVLRDLEARYPGIGERVCDENGQVRRFVNIYVGGEDIRFLQGLETAVSDGAQLSIVPAVAGGA